MDKKIVLGTTIEEELEIVDRIWYKMRHALLSGDLIQDEVLDCLIEYESKLDKELDAAAIDYETELDKELDSAMIDYDVAVDDELGEVNSELPTDAEEILRGLV